MKIQTDAFQDGQPIPPRYAAGALGVTGFADDVNPGFTWSDVPADTRSLVLLCHDPDVPSSGEDVNQPGRVIPATLPRVDFYHWVLVDLPPTLGVIAEGEFSSGFVAGGKPGPAAPHGSRQGLNDYTGWFAGDAAMKGDYFGYDGPYPPGNDALRHRYVFALYALAVPRLAVEGTFTGGQVKAALDALQAQDGVLASASVTGTYTLNPSLA